MTNQVYIGEWRVDLFKDENVEVVSSVLDISDITKNTTDYSKSFAVPASKRNNVLFRHWYNANIDNTFDARTKVPGRIDLGGKPFKVGKWRLQKVSVKKGKPSSYVINFFGNLTSLVDTVRKDHISGLDLSEYDHDYDSETVKTGLTNELFSGDLKYNLFAKKQYYINSLVTDNTQTDKLANISWHGGANTGVVWNDLRPSIRVIKIIEAIETDYAIKFTRDFFGATEFQELFMWLNPSTKKEVGGESQVIDFDGGMNGNPGNIWMNFTTNIGSYDTASSPRRFFQLRLSLNPSVGYEETQYTVKFYVNDEVGLEALGEGTGTWILDLDELDVNNSVYFEITSGQEFKYNTELIQLQKSTPVIITQRDDSTSSENTIDSKFIVSEELPKLKIIDFLKGLFNMYKLVVVPLDNGDIYVNTLNYFYGEGKLYDITKYVDFKSYDVERGKILNEISFKFQEPTTILNVQFEKNTGQGYGDEELFLEDDAGEPLDGDSLTFELPFEQFVYERLIDLNDPNTATNTSNIMYATITDEEGEPTNPKAHLFYNQRVQVGTKTIGFINDSGVKEEISGTINIPSHTNTLDFPSYSTIFGSEFSEWNGIAITNTLYKNHHEKYILDIFNIKKRSFKFIAQMPNFIMTKIALNDVLKIKGNYYRINKYNYNLLTDKTTFDLINSFDNSLVGFSASATDIYKNYLPTTEIVTLSTPATHVKVDSGYGVDWVTVTSGSTSPGSAADGTNILTIALTENTTGVTRDMFITLTQTGSSKELSIYINQTAAVITSDNNLITSDSNLITSDNG